MMTAADRARAYRDRQRGHPPEPRPPAECGTVAAAKRHLRVGLTRTTMDEPCATVLRQYEADRARAHRDRSRKQ